MSETWQLKKETFVKVLGVAICHPDKSNRVSQDYLCVLQFYSL